MGKLKWNDEELIIQTFAPEIGLYLNWVGKVQFWGLLFFFGSISNLVLEKDRFENRFIKSQFNFKIP